MKGFYIVRKGPRSVERGWKSDLGHIKWKIVKKKHELLHYK